MSLDAAPDKFWRLAFPLPYRKSLEEYCRAQMLDPYLMAALIRQESEFNPKAVSRANARGLAQVMPATGRQLSRKLGMRFRTAMLFTPDTNLKIGHLLLESSFPTNCRASGKRRWRRITRASRMSPLGWRRANYREPAEFVESIPVQ